MIRDVSKWQAWERDYIRDTPPDFARNLAIADAMYEQAKALGIFPMADPLEGIEDCIRLARLINVRLPSDENR
jgi:hypothetical protein